MAGAVTVSASVPENPYSSAAQQIVNKQKELDEKEKLLATKEQQLNQDREKETRRMIYLYIIAGSIFFLLLMNYYLDYRRSKRQGPPSNLNPSLKAS